MNRRPLFILIQCIIAVSKVVAATYDVGPGQPLATPSNVAWESLVAGDTVRIHWQANPYRDKWVICRQGTASLPITVVGIPGPNGEKPVIDGNGATTRLALDYWSENRGVIKIGGASIPADITPTHLIIDGLEIRGARPPYSFTDDAGVIQSYPNNSAALYVEKGDQITIRNCVLQDCGNGLFVAATSSNVLVESNYIYNNGNVGSIYEHNSYTAAAGITFQYNRYGPLRSGAGGNNLKDRSAGTVIRYNWIEGGNRQLDLVDAEDSVELQQDSRYHSTFVYGNVLIEPADAGNRQIIHYGGDSGNEPTYRKGTLYLHHNTIVSTRTGRTTLLRLSTNDESADCRNNIIFVTETGNQLELLSNAGVLTLNNNWLKPGWVNSFDPAYTGSVIGAATSITGSDPSFINVNLQNFRLTSGSAGINAASTDHPATITNHHPIREYEKHQRSKPRRPLGTPDLGAFEYSPYAAWRAEKFPADAENDLMSGENADPDGDRILNLLEFAFMQDPKSVSAEALLLTDWATVGQNRYFAIKFQRRPAPTGMRYKAEVTEDLMTWWPGTIYTDTQPPTTSTYTTDASAGGWTRVRLNQTTDSATKRFMRIKVDYE
jgi:Right handed beta helix region